MQVVIKLDGDGEALADVAGVLCAFVDRHQHEGVTISLGNGSLWWEVVGRSLSPVETRKISERLAALSQEPAQP